MRLIRIVPVMVCVLAAPTGAHADAALLQQVHRARLTLSEYALASGSTLDTLRQLDALSRQLDAEAAAEGHAMGAHDPTDTHARLRQELTFLRAAVGVDLWVIAQVSPDLVSLEELATAYGVDDDALYARVQADLDAADVAPFRATVAEARSSLALLSASGEPGARLRTATGLHRDLLWLKHLRGLMDESPQRLAELSRLGDDPCGAAAGECPLPFALFDAEGRRAVAALRDAGRALARLEQASRQGNPFAAAVALELALERAALMETRLEPALGAAVPLELPRTDADGTYGRPDAIAIVGAGRVELTVVPRVRLSATFEPELVGDGPSLLPAFTSYALPSTYPAYLKPIDAVAQAIAALPPGSRPLSVAVAARADAELDVVARVLLSVHGAGAAPALLVSAQGSADVRALPVEIVRQGDDALADLSLRVRLGGYSVELGGAEQELPRVRSDAGLHFDLEALQSTLARAQAKRARVSFMHGTQTQTLLKALACVAAASPRIELLLP